MSDTKGVAIKTDGHLTWLKWHRGHRQAGDISFTRQRIAERRYGFAPIVVIAIGPALLAGDLFAVDHQLRTAFARDHPALDGLDFAPGRILRVERDQALETFQATRAIGHHQFGFHASILMCGHVKPRL